MKKFYTDTAANLLCNMRIRIEGIVQLYEDDAAPLQRLAETNDMLTTDNEGWYPGCVLQALPRLCLGQDECI